MFNVLSILLHYNKFDTDLLLLKEDWARMQWHYTPERLFMEIETNMSQGLCFM